MPRSFLIKKKPEKAPKNTVYEAKPKGGIQFLFVHLSEFQEKLSTGNKCIRACQGSARGFENFRCYISHNFTSNISKSTREMPLSLYSTGAYM